MDRQDKVEKVFRFFDCDGDGLWSFEEASAVQRETEGTVLEGDQWLAVCDWLGAESTGLTLKDVIRLYADKSLASIDMDCEIVERLAGRLNSPLVTPASPALSTGGRSERIVKAFCSALDDVQRVESHYAGFHSTGNISPLRCSAKESGFHLEADNVSHISVTSPSALYNDGAPSHLNSPMSKHTQWIVVPCDDMTQSVAFWDSSTGNLVEFYAARSEKKGRGLFVRVQANNAVGNESETEFGEPVFSLQSSPPTPRRGSTESPDCRCRPARVRHLQYSAAEGTLRVSKNTVLALPKKVSSNNARRWSTHSGIEDQDVHQLLYRLALLSDRCSVSHNLPIVGALHDEVNALRRKLACLEAQWDTTTGVLRKIQHALDKEPANGTRRTSSDSSEQGTEALSRRGTTCANLQEYLKRHILAQTADSSDDLLHTVRKQAAGKPAEIPACDATLPQVPRTAEGMDEPAAGKDVSSSSDAGPPSRRQLTAKRRAGTEAMLHLASSLAKPRRAASRGQNEPFSDSCNTDNGAPLSMEGSTQQLQQQQQQPRARANSEKLYAKPPIDGEDATATTSGAASLQSPSSSHGGAGSGRGWSTGCPQRAVRRAASDTRIGGNGGEALRRGGNGGHKGPSAPAGGAGGGAKRCSSDRGFVLGGGPGGAACAGCAKRGGDAAGFWNLLGAPKMQLLGGSGGGGCNGVADCGLDGEKGESEVEEGQQQAKLGRRLSADDAARALKVAVNIGSCFGEAAPSPIVARRSKSTGTAASPPASSPPAILPLSELVEDMRVSRRQTADITTPTPTPTTTPKQQLPLQAAGNTRSPAEEPCDIVISVTSSDTVLFPGGRRGDKPPSQAGSREPAASGEDAGVRRASLSIGGAVASLAGSEHPLHTSPSSQSKASSRCSGDSDAAQSPPTPAGHVRGSPRYSCLQPENPNLFCPPSINLTDSGHPRPHGRSDCSSNDKPHSSPVKGPNSPSDGPPLHRRFPSNDFSDPEMPSASASPITNHIPSPNTRLHTALDPALLQPPSSPEPHKPLHFRTDSREDAFGVPCRKTLSHSDAFSLSDTRSKATFLAFGRRHSRDSVNESLFRPPGCSFASHADDQGSRSPLNDSRKNRRSTSVYTTPEVFCRKHSRDSASDNLFRRPGLDEQGLRSLNESGRTDNSVSTMNEGYGRRPSRDSVNSHSLFHPPDASSFSLHDSGKASGVGSVFGRRLSRDSAHDDRPKGWTTRRQPQQQQHHHRREKTQRQQQQQEEQRAGLQIKPPPAQKALSNSNRSASDAAGTASDLVFTQVNSPVCAAASVDAGLGFFFAQGPPETGRGGGGYPRLSVDRASTPSSSPSSSSSSSSSEASLYDTLAAASHLEPTLSSDSHHGHNFTIDDKERTLPVCLHVFPVVDRPPCSDSNLSPVLSPHDGNRRRSSATDDALEAPKIDPFSPSYTMITALTSPFDKHALDHAPAHDMERDAYLGSPAQANSPQRNGTSFASRPAARTATAASAAAHLPSLLQAAALATHPLPEAADSTSSETLGGGGSRRSSAGPSQPGDCGVEPSAKDELSDPDACKPGVDHFAKLRARGWQSSGQAPEGGAGDGRKRNSLAVVAPHAAGEECKLGRNGAGGEGAKGCKGACRRSRVTCGPYAVAFGPCSPPTDGGGGGGEATPVPMRVSIGLPAHQRAPVQLKVDTGHGPLLFSLRVLPPRKFRVKRTTKRKPAQPQPEEEAEP
eukprot:gene4666-7163_t